MGYPYYGPGWVPVADSDTRKGLGNFLKAMYLSLILILVSTLVLGVVSRSLSGLEDVQNEEDAMGMMGSIAILAIGGIVLLIAGLAALVLFIMGLVSIHRGRQEFGPAHEASIRLALIFLVLAILVSVISAGVVAAMAFSSVANLDQDPGNMFGMQNDLTWAGVAGGSMGIVSSIFQYLFMVHLAKELVMHQQRNGLWAGFGVGVCGSVVNLIITVLLFRGLVTISASDLEAAFYTSVIPMALSLVALVIFITVYRGVIARMDSGELRPLPRQYYPIPPPPQWVQ